MPITPNLTGCVMRHGRRSINMYLPWPTGRARSPFYFGDWIRTPGVAICSCNDGLRPVIFKLEATDQDVQINYVPVN